MKKDKKEEVTDWSELIKSERKNCYSSTIWDYRDRDKLETFWVSDVHLGNHCCDEELFLKNLEYIQKRDMPFADLGDLIETATRDSVGAGVYEQDAITDAQMIRAIELYKPLSGLLKVMYPGNHEARIFKSAGLNITRQMANQIGVKYGGIGGFNIIKVGKQTYKVYATHGGSGAWTVGGKFNSILRLAQSVDAEIVVSGHLHDTIYHSREKLLVKETGEIYKTKQHLIINGSYLNWWGSYAQEKGYPIGNKGNAKITFYGDKHHAEVSFV